MKPYVICHMVTSIDGRILPDRWPKIPGQPDTTKLYESTAASFGIDAWIVGTTTMKEFAGRPVTIKKAARKVPPGDHVARSDATAFAIGIDAKGVLPWSKGEVDGEHVISILTRRASNDYLAHLQSKGVSYLICGEREVDLALALEKLNKALRIKKLMLEGGGKINGSFLRAGLIDEVSQITVPVADGGTGVPSVFDIAGEPPRKAAALLKLILHRKLPGGAQWARYKVVNAKRKR